MPPLTGQPYFIKIRLNSTIYGKEAILAANYALSNLCSSRIESDIDGYFDVIIEPLVENNNIDLAEVKQRFINELTDQQLRLDLDKKNAPLRDLIVKQAFSPLKNLQTEVEKLVSRA